MVLRGRESSCNCGLCHFDVSSRKGAAGFVQLSYGPPLLSSSGEANMIRLCFLIFVPGVMQTSAKQQVRDDLTRMYELAESAPE